MGNPAEGDGPAPEEQQYHPIVEKAYNTDPGSLEVGSLASNSPEADSIKRRTGTRYVNGWANGDIEDITEPDAVREVVADDVEREFRKRGLEVDMSEIDPDNPNSVSNRAASEVEELKEKQRKANADYEKEV